MAICTAMAMVWLFTLFFEYAHSFSGGASIGTVVHLYSKTGTGDLMLEGASISGLTPFFMLVLILIGYEFSALLYMAAVQTDNMNMLRIIVEGTYTMVTLCCLFLLVELKQATFRKWLRPFCCI